ncbi:MAG: hypothetical protein IT462_09535 [Planctomycetes bacterium]|nr:hypothetical protein [Planctomycetota bacterium]
MDYELVSAKSVRLRTIAKNEAWLEERLRANPALLGPEFEGTKFLDNQRPTPGGGRLDLLLYDDENDRRYVCELMLGSLDEAHLVRTIEYWDIERRRFPAYEHVAVIAAEDITSRFLNVIALFWGNIPIIVLQLSALVVEGKLALQFTKVMDLRELRRDDETESSGAGSDRQTWMEKTTPEIMGQIDGFVRFLQKLRAGLELSYLIHYMGIKINGVSNNFVTFQPKTKWLDITFFDLTDRDAWLGKFKAAKLDTGYWRDRGLWIRVLPSEFTPNRELIEQALKDVAKE